MSTLTTLAVALQVLFTTTAVRLGRITQLFRRQRLLTADDFAQTLVFGWIESPRSSLESFAVRLDLSPQAVQHRRNPRARQFFSALIADALRTLHAARPQPFGLLRRFRAVVVEDATIVPLPAECAHDWPGTGGSDPQRGQAAMKVFIRWELITGQLLSLECLPQRTNDATRAATADELPVGALHLADQGVFDSRRWQHFRDRFWISRVPSTIRVKAGDPWQGIADWLRGRRAEPFDGRVQLVESDGLSGRLVARRCPPAVAAMRRRKLRAYYRDKRGREPSVRQLVSCDWLVLATNVPASRLKAVELWVVYRCRWQVELLWERCKSQLGWTTSWGRRGERVVVEVLAKVLGMVVVLWGSWLGGGPLAGRSAWKQWQIVRRFAERLREALTSRGELVRVLSRLQHELGRLKPQPARRPPSTRQLLLKPTLAA